MKKNIEDKRYMMYSSFSPEEQSVYYKLIYNFLWCLNIEYPKFAKWYHHLFEKDNSLKNNREIIICENQYQIAGIAILKADKDEKKICTLRVAKQFQRQGIGKRLMELSFNWLQDDKPLITMHRTKQKEFQPLLDYYGFVLEQKSLNYYHIFSTEYVYNGSLPEKKLFFNDIELLELDYIYKKFVRSEKYNVHELVEYCVEWWLDKEKKREIQMLKC